MTERERDEADIAACIRERKPINEQFSEEDIDFDENPTTGVFLKIMTTSYDDLEGYCQKHRISQADFIEHAIQRELDYRNGDLRYVIKHVMAKIYKED